MAEEIYRLGATFEAKDDFTEPVTKMTASLGAFKENLQEKIL